MRENRRFAERTKVLDNDEARSKYFLVYEGAETELIYFEAVSRFREQIGINPLIELIPIVRSFSEEGWSNPKKILDRIIENLRESKEGTISYETLFNRIIDYLKEIKIITTSKVMAKDIWKTLTQTCVENIGASLTDNVENIDEACSILVEALNEKYKAINIVDNVADIIKNGGITYEEGFDKICLIVDRDKNSFVSNPGNDQYDYVVKQCAERDFYLCVTNPCFEFWLLLHYPDISDLNYEMLLANNKVTRKKTYCEQQLCMRCSGYKKSCYPAEEFVKNIDVAIENEHLFCEDVGLLKDKIGSNIGTLINEMKN